MQYLCLIYSDGSEQQAMDAEARQAYMSAYGAFTQAIKDNGNFLAADALQGVETATSVRVRDGKTLITDGPFAETKEFLGGFYLVEAKDLDEAIGIAARIPTAKHGTIEVRPIMKWD